MLDEGPQPADVRFAGGEGAGVAPAAIGQLSGGQTQRRLFDPPVVAGLAEAVQEQDRQGKVVSGIRVRDAVADDSGRLFDHRIAGRDIGFEQGQACQGRDANRMIRFQGPAAEEPGSVGMLMALEIGDAALHGCPHVLV